MASGFGMVILPKMVVPPSPMDILWIYHISNFSPRYMWLTVIIVFHKISTGRTLWQAAFCFWLLKLQDRCLMSCPLVLALWISCELYDGALCLPLFSCLCVVLARQSNSGILVLLLLLPLLLPLMSLCLTSPGLAVFAALFAIPGLVYAKELAPVRLCSSWYERSSQL